MHTHKHTTHMHITHTYTQWHTCIQHIHTFVHQTCMHTPHTYTYAFNTHAYSIHMYTHAYTFIQHIWIHTCIQHTRAHSTHMHIHMHATYTCIYTCMQHTCTHTAYAYMHTRHKFKCTHTYTLKPISQSINLYIPRIRTQSGKCLSGEWVQPFPFLSLPLLFGRDSVLCSSHTSENSTGVLTLPKAPRRFHDLCVSPFTHCESENGGFHRGTGWG